MTDEITFGEHEIQMVFLNRRPKQDLELIRGWLKSGYILTALNEDKAYFQRREQKGLSA